MKKIVIKTYKYAELSEDAKEKARNWYLKGFDFQFEWDCIQGDAKTIGLKLEEWEYRRYAKGDFETSGRECAEKIIKEHGKHCETYKTAKAFLKDWKIADREDEKKGIDEKTEEVEAEFLKSLLEDYRINADEEYEYVQSEEAIAESIEANEYDFLEDGTRFSV